MAAGNATVRSDVWKWFNKCSDTSKVECTLCKKIIAYRRGTTNLRNHLLSKHPLTYKPVSAGTQTTIDTVIKHQYCSQPKAEEITQRILLMIALDLRPVRMVEAQISWHTLSPGTVFLVGSTSLIASYVKS